MSVPDTSEITLGKIVKSKTINPHDNVQWVGRITRLCEFPEAEVFADVLPYAIYFLLPMLEEIHASNKSLRIRGALGAAFAMLAVAGAKLSKLMALMSSWLKVKPSLTAVCSS